MAENAATTTTRSKGRRAMRAQPASEIFEAVIHRGEAVRDWQRWAPYAAVAWSVIYAALGLGWALGMRGFPYTTGTVSDLLGPLMERLGPSTAWVAVATAGMPAAAMGVAMVRGVRGRTLRPLFITGGALLAGVLLLLMTGLTLLVLFGYAPRVVIGMFTGAAISWKYLRDLTGWPVLHQLLCLVGGFLWLAATVSYARKTGDACPSCGRQYGPEGWQAPHRAARWGRIAVYVSLLAPLFYAFTRYAWALGFAVGMSEEDLRRGQGTGMWISGLFLATFGLVGAALSFGLVQRWGEAFPRWVVGLAGRRVPIALAVIPASFVSVLLTVGGIVVWSHLPRMITRLAARGADGLEITGAIFFQVGGVLLFPVWGAAIAVAALGYYYRRRMACVACGPGASIRSHH
jgi:hypothetical protein